MALSPFIWGQNGQQLTPAQAKAMRDVASAIAAKRDTPKNLGEGLASVGDALLYNSNLARAGEAEAAGLAQVEQALAEARASGSSDGFLDVMGNAWATPAQQLVAGELYKRSIPDWQTFESGGDLVRWNANDPNAAPSVFYDGPESASDVRYGVTPIWGQFEDGTWGYGVQGSDGSFLRVDTGGFTPADPRTINQERAAGTTTGREQAELAVQAPAAAANLDRLDAQTDNVIETIDKATGQIAWDSTGLIGQVMGGIAGSKAFDLRETAKTIKANLGFAELQAMREASPTGGALGQVAVQELESLQSTLASLNPDQSDGQLRENLMKVRELLERQKTYRRAAMEAKFSGGAAAPAASSAPDDDVDGILQGYGL